MAVDREKLIARLMVTFLDELAENIRAFDRDLLALEKAGGHDHDGVMRLLRTAHSVKGAARSVGLTAIEAACHNLEDILGRIRDGKLSPTPTLLAVFFAVVDALGDAGQQLKSSKVLDTKRLNAVIDDLKRLLADDAAAAVPTQPTGESSPTPIAPAETVSAPAGASPASSLGKASPVLAPSPGGDPLGGATVRVAVEKLDRLLVQTSELSAGLTRAEAPLAELSSVQEDLSRLRKRGAAAFDPELTRRLEKSMAHATKGLTAAWRGLRAAARNVESQAHRACLLPFQEACEGLERSARDLAELAGKRVSVKVLGGGVELDRGLLEALKDPLRHLVRNAVDHGVERPDVRVAAGKAAGGTITIAAAVRGSIVDIDINDDGAGINSEALSRQLERRELKIPEDPQELARSIFLPGLSTAAIITDVSGRGVGLDIVRSKVEEHRGTVDVRSEPRRGTSFKLTLPLTLSTMQGFLVAAGGQELAFPSAHVERAFRVPRQALRSVEGRPALALGGTPVPIASLAAVLGLSAVDAGEQEHIMGVVLKVPAGRWAFATDSLLAEQELVVKSLGARLRRLPHVSGATVLSSGRIALVLNAASLVAGAIARPGDGGIALKAAKKAKKYRILIADDSVTTRSLERGILEAAGYDVIVASDGELAWTMLAETAVDLLVSDVEMPRMNGYELTQAVRSSVRLKKLPVILLTGLDTAADKQKGIEAGADAYLVKSSFDQASLLDTVAQLL